MHIRKNIFVSYLSLGLACMSVHGTSLYAEKNWLQFRGSNFNPVVSDAKLPIEFGGDEKKNIAWRTEIPGRSVGGVIVVGDQVITTTSTGMDQRRIQLLSYSSKDGSQLWEQEFVARGRPFCHPTSANAAPTPASDGENIYAFFSSNDLACVNLQGELLWYRSLASDFPKAGNDTGMSSSPVIVDGVCVVQVECQGDSFAAGLDTRNGAILWKIDRPSKANWSSPTSAKSADGKSWVIMHSGSDLLAVSPKDGSVQWKIDIGCSTYSSSLAVNNRLFVPAGGMTAFDLSSVGKEPSKLWDENKLNSNPCSPVVLEDRIYAVNKSILICSDIYTGKVIWQSRIAEGSVWSSPVVVGRNLFLFSQDGKCSVVKLGEKEGERLATNSLGDDVLGSPAVVNNAMYVRSVSALWKIAE
jgi:outer membrane protein assembly factor BamB